MTFRQHAELSHGEIPYTIWFGHDETAPVVGESFEVGDGRTLIVKEVVMAGGNAVVYAAFYRTGATPGRDEPARSSDASEIAEKRRRHERGAGLSHDSYEGLFFPR